LTREIQRHKRSRGCPQNQKKGKKKGVVPSVALGPKQQRKNKGGLRKKGGQTVRKVKGLGEMSGGGELARYRVKDEPLRGDFRETSIKMHEGRNPPGASLKKKSRILPGWGGSNPKKLQG